MTKKQRWIKSIIATADDATVALPFQRGNRDTAAERAKTAA
ncbi:hypothetical protein [Maritimibacter dapengensis]|nr:hypothetical protein [Maritimibacter dapengensis]